MQTHGYIDPHRIHTAYDSNTVLETVASQQRERLSGSSNHAISHINGLESRSVSGHHPSHHYESRPGIRHTFVDIFERGGVKGFFKGIMLNVIKGPITLGISFTVYDIAKHKIEVFYKLK